MRKSKGVTVGGNRHVRRKKGLFRKGRGNNERKREQSRRPAVDRTEKGRSIVLFYITKRRN